MFCSLCLWSCHVTTVTCNKETQWHFQLPKQRRYTLFDLELRSRELQLWSKILLECVIIASWNACVHYRIHNSPTLDPFHSHMNPVHIVTSYFYKNNFNIVLFSVHVLQVLLGQRVTITYEDVPPLLHCQLSSNHSTVSCTHLKYYGRNEFAVQSKTDTVPNAMVAMGFRSKGIFTAVSDFYSTCRIKVRPETSLFTFPTAGKTPE